MLNVEVLKAVYDLLQEAKHIELAEQLMEIRTEMVNVGEDNIQLRQEVSTLKEALRLKSTIVFERGICWVKKDEMTEGKTDTPICPICYQVDGIVNRIQIRTGHKGQSITCRRGHGHFYIQ